MSHGISATDPGPANTTLPAIVTGAAGALTIVALTYFRDWLYGFHGLLAAAGFAALAYSPLVGRQTELRRFLLALAVVVLIAGNFFGGIAWMAQSVIVGVAMALAVARLLPYEAGMAVRLAASLGSTVSFLVLSVGVAVGVSRVARDGSVVQGSLVLAIVALLGMQVTLWAALRKIRAEARARSATPAIQTPQGWFWGKLNHRALGKQALGYRYVDPTRGASFHVVGELDALPSAEALRRAGYRGSETVRLGGHVTMYPQTGASAEDASFLQRQFAEGGPVGVVVLALSADERRALGLPDAPPWISSYLA
jgi:hypothetical protein